MSDLQNVVMALGVSQQEVDAAEANGTLFASQRNASCSPFISSRWMARQSR